MTEQLTRLLRYFRRSFWEDRRDRPAVLIAAGVLVYLAVECWPDLSRAMWDIRRALPPFQPFPSSSFEWFVIWWAVLALLCLVAHLAIWVVSIFVAWAAFQRSGKVAYLFILASFLMMVAFLPLRLFIRETRPEKPISEQRDRPRVVKEEAIGAGMAVDSQHNMNVYLPVESFLLLAGLWYLYRQETPKGGEPSAGEPPRPTAANPSAPDPTSPGNEPVPKTSPKDESIT